LQWSPPNKEPLNTYQARTEYCFQHNKQMKAAVTRVLYCREWINRNGKMKGLSDGSDDAALHATRSSVGDEKSGIAELKRMKVQQNAGGSRSGRRVS
jgi:hypothetical protein